MKHTLDSEEITNAVGEYIASRTSTSGTVRVSLFWDPNSETVCAEVESVDDVGASHTQRGPLR